MSDQADAATRLPAPSRHGAPIYSHLPRFWPLLALDALALIAEFLIVGILLTVKGTEPTDEQAMTLGFCALLWPVLWVAGWLYWTWCIYRVHKVLAEYTGGNYPISPRRAVGFGLIPVFGWVWSFLWTRKLDEFLKERAGEQRQTRTWPGLLLVPASLFGFVQTLRLALLFAVGADMGRRLRQTLPSPEPLPFRRRHQFSLAISAGVGAAFSFVIFQSLRDFFFAPKAEKTNEVAAIVLVSIAVLIFLEPLFDRIRRWLGLEHHEKSVRARTWRLRVAIFLILAAVSTLHGMLHTAIDEALRQAGISQSLAALAGLFVVTATITFVWIGASHRHPPHAARSGVLSGALVGAMVAIAVNAFMAPAAAEGLAEPQSHQEQSVVNTVDAAAPVCPSPAKAQAEPPNSGSGDSQSAAISKTATASPISTDSAHTTDASNAPAIASRKAESVQRPESKEPAHKPLEFMSAMGSASKTARLNEPRSIFLMALPWALLGLVGGLIIDRAWGRNRLVFLAATLVVCALLYSGALAIFTGSQSQRMWLHISAVAGWALALWIGSASSLLVLDAPKRHKAQAAAAGND